MTKKLFLSFSVLCILAISQSCSVDSCGTTKDAFLNHYNGFMEEVKAANLAVSNEAWSKYDDRFRNYVENCYEHFEPELTGREKRRFWASAMSYYYSRYGKSLGKELFGKENEEPETLQERFKELFKQQ